MGQPAKVTNGMRIAYNGTVYVETTQVSPPPTSVEKVDSTAHDDSQKFTQPGELAEGDMTFTVNFINDTAQIALKALMRAKTVGTWDIIYPKDYSTPFFTQRVVGFVSSLKPTTPRKGAVATWDLTITPQCGVDDITATGAALTTPFLSIVDEDGHAITLTPAASATAYEYECTAYTGSASVLITPTSTGAGTIYVNGAIVASGAASAAIPITQTAGAITKIFVLLMKTNCCDVPILIKVKMGLAAYV